MQGINTEYNLFDTLLLTISKLGHFSTTSAQKLRNYAVRCRCELLNNFSERKGFIMIAKSKNSLNKLNLYLDLVLVVGFLITMEEKLTGQTLHEWLGIALGASLVVHLLLHWNWIVVVTQRFFRKIPRPTRLNYTLNTAFFAAFTLIIFSGLMISESVTGILGLTGSQDPFWKMLHFTASNTVLVLVGLHIALHWQWVVNAFKRYVFSRMQDYFVRQPVAGLTSATATHK